VGFSLIFPYPLASRLSVCAFLFVFIPMAENISLGRHSGQENTELKTPYQTDEKLDVQDVASPSYNGGAYDDIWGDTEYDIRDMHRLGKKQEFKVFASPARSVRNLLTYVQRNFNFLSTLGFVSIYMATWEFVLVYVQTIRTDTTV
jgi:hypothetical protein